MPFSSATTIKIRYVLGYPSVYQFSNPRLESAILVVGQDADQVALVQGILDKVDAVTATFGDVLDNAGLKGLGQGEVEFYDASELPTKARIGRMYVGQLSIIFGVPVANDIFGSGGYQGDGWKANNARVKLAGLG